MKAVLDSNLFFSVWRIDPLLTFAENELYTPVWSDTIMCEVREHLAEVWKYAPSQSIHYYLDEINRAYPDAIVRGWERLLEDIHLPDIDDRHVLAAAIEASSPIIVTENLKHFPEIELSRYGIVAESSDMFLTARFDDDPESAYEAVNRLVGTKQHPPRTIGEEIRKLRELGMQEFAARLQGYQPTR